MQIIILFAGFVSAAAAADAPLDYTITLETTFEAPEDAQGWFQPRPVAIPSDDGGVREIAMTVQKILGSDFFTGLYVTKREGPNGPWTAPVALEALGWRKAEGEPLTTGICDFTWGWHAPTRKAIGIGHTAKHDGKKFAGYGNRRDTVYSVYDPAEDTWSPWTVFAFPETEGDKYFFNGVHGQWLVEPDGTLLVPVYYVGPNQKFVAKGMIARLAFDGSQLSFVERGPDLVLDIPRGLYEKSITFYDGRYYMTMRNDEKGYVAVSADGLSFSTIRPWTFDDGAELGSYNTQQKWVTHSDGLFLVYTRRGANNDHIVRHRAPLFIARVDTERLCVLRDTERILVPERGKALGNFDASAINAYETWVTVAGGDAFCARIRWNRPNRLAARVNG